MTERMKELLQVILQEKGSYATALNITGITISEWNTMCENQEFLDKYEYIRDVLIPSFTYVAARKQYDKKVERGEDKFVLDAINRYEKAVLNGELIGAVFDATLDNLMSNKEFASLLNNVHTLSTINNGQIN